MACGYVVATMIGRSNTKINQKQRSGFGCVIAACCIQQTVLAPLVVRSLAQTEAEVPYIHQQLCRTRQRTTHGSPPKGSKTATPIHPYLELIVRTKKSPTTATDPRLTYLHGGCPNHTNYLPTKWKCCRCWSFATPELALICMHIWLILEYWNSAKSGLNSLRPTRQQETQQRKGRATTSDHRTQPWQAHSSSRVSSLDIHLLLLDIRIA